MGSVSAALDPLHPLSSPLPSRMPGTEIFNKFQQNNRTSGRRGPILTPRVFGSRCGVRGPILGAQCPSLSLPPRKQSSVPSEHLLPPSPRPPPHLGPHQPRCPPSPLQPRRPIRALNLPRKLPEKTGRSSSPPSSSHSRGAAHGADSGEPTSAPKGDLFRIPEGPAPVPNREPIRTAVSAPGPAPHTALARRHYGTTETRLLGFRPAVIVQLFGFSELAVAMGVFE